MTTDDDEKALRKTLNKRIEGARWWKLQAFVAVCFMVTAFSNALVDQWWLVCFDVVCVLCYGWMAFRSSRDKKWAENLLQRTDDADMLLSVAREVSLRIAMTSDRQENLRLRYKLLKVKAELMQLHGLRPDEREELEHFLAETRAAFLLIENIDLEQEPVQ